MADVLPVSFPFFCGWLKPGSTLMLTMPMSLNRALTAASAISRTCWLFMSNLLMVAPAGTVRHGIGLAAHWSTAELGARVGSHRQHRVLRGVPLSGDVGRRPVPEPAASSLRCPADD